MSDYIKREDVEQIFTEWCHKEQISVMFCDVIMRRLQRLPSADVVEVVRCKDCKYGEENCKSPIYGMWCKRFGAEKSNLAVLPTDYCSYGEEQEHE